MTAINLSKNYLEGGLVAFDLSIDAPPRNFLGLATDIVFEGDFAAAGYRGMEWGALIAGMPESERPIQMVKALPDQSRVVLGMTFRADRLPELSSGALARLVFEKDLLKPVSLEERVLSVYDGVRKDLPSVEWTIAALPDAIRSPADTGAVADGKVVVPPAGFVSNGSFPGPVGGDFVVQADSSGYAIESNWQEMALMDVLNSPSREEPWSVFPWLLWPWGIAVVAIALGAWFFRRSGRSPAAADLA